MGINYLCKLNVDKQNRLLIPVDVRKTTSTEFRVKCPDPSKEFIYLLEEDDVYGKKVRTDNKNRICAKGLLDTFFGSHTDGLWLVAVDGKLAITRVCK